MLGYVCGFVFLVTLRVCIRFAVSLILVLFGLVWLYVGVFISVFARFARLLVLLVRFVDFVG